MRVIIADQEGKLYRPDGSQRILDADLASKFTRAYCNQEVVQHLLGRDPVLMGDMGELVVSIRCRDDNIITSPLSLDLSGELAYFWFAKEGLQGIVYYRVFEIGWHSMTGCYIKDIKSAIFHAQENIISGAWQLTKSSHHPPERKAA